MMRKLLGTLVMVLIVVGAIGYWQGWFDVSRVREDGQTNLELKINRDKIREDTKELTEKVEAKLGDETVGR